ncbi:dienelactone hydrolase family protein [Rhodococcus fascians]|nr:dienelactone hydrolase family protein [Rhodococcus fascians]MBY4114569.1 dienelactone hydrolase family protein [Rhodococcus fascians]
MPFTRLVDCGMDHADARELLCSTAAGRDWGDTAKRIGVDRLAAAQRAVADGRAESARQLAVYAAAAFNFAQMASNQDTPEKVETYLRHVDSVRLSADLSDGLLEELSVAYGPSQLTGWLALPSAGPPVGTVVLWGGLSGWGASYLNTARAYTRRGLACIMAEGPGQGQPRLLHGIHARPDTVNGFSRFLDVAEQDPRLNSRIGLQGNSFGGLFAAHIASTDPRVAAVVVNGAPARPTVPEFRSAREQIFALLGTEDIELASALLDQFRFEPAQQPIAVPCLILQGGADKLAGPRAQAPFAEAARHPESATLTWPDGEHTLYNHAAERDSLVGDWFTDLLTR